MLNPKLLRENPQLLDAMLQKRGAQPVSATLVQLDEERRGVMAQVQSLQSQRNDFSKQIGHLKTKGEDASALFEQMKTISPKIKQMEEQERALQQRFDALWATLPNLLMADVPAGVDDTDNVEISRWGTPAAMDFDPKQHFELGSNLGMMDFDVASTIAGSRFYWNQGELARLERALAMFMLDTHTSQNGFTEVAPPLLVTPKTMFGTGQYPKFADDAFVTNDERELALIPTSEVSLTNYMQEKLIREDELPLRFVAYTPCFRKEAGSAGRDTRGIIRVHHFNKVEMVQIVHPEKSAEALEFMRRCAEDLLQKLYIPYRVVSLCGGDIGFASAKTYDIEAWLPGQKAYREISSCSNCTDFQARRMNARFKDTDGKNHFVHTLNGSGLPTGRTLVAVMENYQQADGSIRVPTVLQPYMGGLQVIKKRITV